MLAFQLIANGSADRLSAAFGGYVGVSTVPHLNSSCMSVNAFTCNWEGDFNWLCPPINLIGGTIKHAAFMQSQRYFNGTPMGVVILLSHYMEWHVI